MLTVPPTQNKREKNKPANHKALGQQLSHMLAVAAAYQDRLGESRPRQFNVYVLEWHFMTVRMITTTIYPECYK